MLTSLAAAAPAIAMLGCFACVAGGAVLIVRRRDIRKGVLMLVMAAVLLANVLVWVGCVRGNPLPGPAPRPLLPVRSNAAPKPAPRPGPAKPKTKEDD